MLGESLKILIVKTGIGTKHTEEYRTGIDGLYGMNRGERHVIGQLGWEEHG